MDEGTAVVATFAALFAESEDVARSFLLAALYAVAVASNDSPRNILDALFKALPSDDAWPALQAALLSCME